MTTSHILWPRPSLAGCIFAAIVRDTRGVTLTQDQRFNHFPAGPFCCVSWALEGECHVLYDRDLAARPWAAPPMPRIAFSGPQRGPLLSWNPGPVHAVTLAFYPDAFAALARATAGIDRPVIDMSAYVDRTVAADEVLPAALLDLCRHFLQCGARVNTHRSFRTLEDGLEVLWHAARPDGHVVTGWLRDWGTALAARASVSGLGRSARQIERRIKSWTGLTERDLSTFGRSEQLYARMGAALQAGELDWAKLAVDSGFADQSHMSRRVRRDTGFTPEQLRRRAMSDESLWCYRLLGQRY